MIKKWHVHVAFWLGYVIFNALIISIGNNRFDSLFLYFLTIVPAVAPMSYAIQHQVDKILRGEAKLISILMVVIVTALGFVAVVLIENVVFPKEVFYWSFRNLISEVFAVCQFLVFHFVWVAVDKEKKLKELRYAQLAAELNALKNQINPHFLFNTLNNVYALINLDKEKAGEVVLTLSRMLHYLLVESNAELVPLQRELDLIRQYMDLERIRNEDKVDVEFRVEPNDSDFLVAPMLLLPLVENAFKHGVYSSVDRSWVSFQMKVENETMHLRLENSQGKKSQPGMGIGLRNLRERLKLIYPGKHQLKIVSGPESFLVLLSLDTNLPAQTV